MLWSAHATLALALLALTACQEPATATSEASPLQDAEASPTLSSSDTSRPEATEPAPRREVLIAASGDVLIHRRVLESAQAHEGRFQYVLGPWGQALTKLRGAGLPVLALVNLETPLTEAYADPLNENPPVLGSPPELAADLAALGVDLVSVANNHALDQTADGLADTLATARAAGLATVGAGPDQATALRPWVTSRGGLKIAVIAAAGHVNRGPGRTAKQVMYIHKLRDEGPLLEAIRAVRGEVDLVVLALHWSHDFVRQPARAQRELARRLVDAGADLILGSGPHVLQEVERLPSPRGEALVAYSLGNLVSNQGLRYTVGHRINPAEHPVAITPETRDAVLLAVSLRSPEPGRVEVSTVEAHAFWTENNFWERRGRDDVPVEIHLTPLRDLDDELREERQAAISETMGEAVRVLE